MDRMSRLLLACSAWSHRLHRQPADLGVLPRSKTVRGAPLPAGAAFTSAPASAGSMQDRSTYRYCHPSTASVRPRQRILWRPDRLQFHGSRLGSWASRPTFQPPVSAPVPLASSPAPSTQNELFGTARRHISCAPATGCFAGPAATPGRTKRDPHNHRRHQRGHRWYGRDRICRRRLGRGRRHRTDHANVSISGIPALRLREVALCLPLANRRWRTASKDTSRSV